MLQVRKPSFAGLEHLRQRRNTSLSWEETVWIPAVVCEGSCSAQLASIPPPALSLTVAVVVVIAFYQLLRQVAPLVVGGAIDPLNHAVFQALFGAIMTLLIAMEFKHSIIRAALREDNVIQVKTVILISLLALSRKFIILDPAEMGAATIAALAGVTLVLVVYWLLRDLDESGVRRKPRIRDASIEPAVSGEATG